MPSQVVLKREILKKYFPHIRSKNVKLQSCSGGHVEFPIHIKNGWLVYGV